jgi:hypothetical protein
MVAALITRIIRAYVGVPLYLAIYPSREGEAGPDSTARANRNIARDGDHRPVAFPKDRKTPKPLRSVTQMRIRSAALTAGAALAMAACVAGPAAAQTATPPSPTLPSFDYRDCPAIPAGVDPAQWRCEDLVAQGDFKVGDVDVPQLSLTAVTHAEGTLADGTTGQVFGGFRAAASPVTGGLFGGGPSLTVRPEYAGSADFLSPTGAIAMKFRLSGPLLGRRCMIGSDTDPVKIVTTRVPGTAVWVSQDPPIRRFDATDTTFSMPKAHGCGVFDRVIDRRFGLPSAAGANSLAVTAYYSYKTYDTITGH